MGWALFNGAVFEDEYIKVLGETYSAARSFTGDVNISGDKLYSSVYIGENTLSATPYIYDISFAGGSLSPYYGLCPIGYTGQASVITSVHGRYRWRATSSSHIGWADTHRVFYLKDLIVINLTQTFGGAGNEPTKKEEMELTYFNFRNRLFLKAK